ncbi:MAG: glycosyl hydrolase 53 family protein [Ignavibacteriaceae bacterium]|nr:glycosyl hydrolase 53 family protein [Ignavibacteriaceae bacterium]
MKKIFLVLLSINFYAAAQTNDFIKGVDVSFIPQIEDLGGKFYWKGNQTDPLDIFKQNEIGYIRLRLWHTPANGYCGLASTLDMASRLKQKGFKFLLNFHYSDSWADPGQQTKPAAWQGLTYSQLVDSIYSYTFSVIRAFDSVNALPDMIQIGNEIISGMLWPEGRVGGSYNTTQQWTQFTTLLKTARTAIINAVPNNNIPIMIHIDRGGDNSGSRWFYDNLNLYQVPFDIIGLSFYPWWHGTLTKLSQNLNDLAGRYGKDVIVAEVAYPWTLQPFDNNGNIVGSSSQLHTGYPSTVQGQFNYLYDLINIVKQVPNNRGRGVFYWAPEYISVQPIGSPWENLTLFNFQGETLSSISAFKDEDTLGINVTFRLNTSTNWDTLHTNSFVQIRGEVVSGSSLLPSGEQILWDQNSDLIMNNVHGDYWEKTVRVIPGSEIHYKYWTGHSLTKPTFLRLGWEGPIQPYDLSSGNYRKFIAGTSDTVLQVEYYSSYGTTVNQYWKPFQEKLDSIAVYFRVNTGGITSNGRFNPNVNGPIGVRGNDVDSFHVLSWDYSDILSREDLSVYNGSFWSGVVYYPSNATGKEQKYKFFIENDTQNGWENSIADRVFSIPAKDSTLNWVSFDNQFIVTSVENEKNSLMNFNLHQNYPNPFNPITTINYSLIKDTFVKLIVFNFLGEEMNILVNEFQLKGEHTVIWNGKDYNNSDLSSGIYLIKLISDSRAETIKTILLR